MFGHYHSRSLVLISQKKKQKYEIYNQQSHYIYLFLGYLIVLNIKCHGPFYCQALRGTKHISLSNQCLDNIFPVLTSKNYGRGQKLNFVLSRLYENQARLIIPTM